MTDDPTRVTNQPALATSTGRIWLIVGGLFALIAVGLLLAMSTLPPAGVALGGAVAVAALYLGMIAVRLTVRAGRLRLGLMAAAMIGIATVSLVATAIVAFATWAQV